MRPDDAVLDVQQLCVSAGGRIQQSTSIVSDISFSVAPGKVTALIGESGSGKTTIALACLGYTRPGCRIDSGDVRVGDTKVLSLTTHQRRKLRGKIVAYVAQSAAASFNSALTLDRQVTEPALLHAGMSKTKAMQKAQQLYRELDLPEPELIGRRYPHQVSGGQLQRLMAAMAMICDPRLLILDEPTTALDVTTQIDVLRSFKKLIRSKQTSALYISHDLAVVAQIADQIVVLKDGEVVEQGSTTQIIHNPQHPYTSELIGAAHVMPDKLPAPRGQANTILLRIEGVSASYSNDKKKLVLNDVSIALEAGRTLGVIGESGSGKTTLGRVISGLMPPTEGQVTLNGELLAARIEQRNLEAVRQIQFAFQMADVALNPRQRIGKILGRPVSFYFGLQAGKVQSRVEQLLDLVELPASYMERFPRQLSGGERQRVNLARALAAEPRVIICDEITSALDTVVAKAILALLARLQSELGISYIFISHDLSTIARIADTIAVMRDGRVVEAGSTHKIMQPPFHTYTELLMKSVPEMRADWLDNQ